MTLRAYHDPGVAEEVSSSIGRYLMSYATDYNLVDVHLFEDERGELAVFVTIVPGVRLPEAQAVAHEAARVFEAQRGGEPRKARLVYDEMALYGSGRL